MAVDTLAALQAYRQKIDTALQEFFAELPDLLQVDLSEHSQQALATLGEYSLRPAKRIRGALAAATYDDGTGQQFATVGIQLAVVLELVQDYLLILDDVMDKSVTRRGQPTLQLLYAAETKDYGGETEANMLAINVGVVTQHLANLALIRMQLPPEVLARAIAIMHGNIGATGFGQLDDLYQRVGRDVTEADIIRKYRLKSSYYTFVNPLQLGLTTAGLATNERLETCKTFGEAAGIAFQLRDDYLGMFGDADETGKSNLDDMREGKYTLLVHHALEHASAAEITSLKNILGNPKATAADLQLLQDIFTRSGAARYTQKLAHDYAEQAKASLRAQPIGSQQLQDLLAELVDYSVERHT